MQAPVEWEVRSGREDDVEEIVELLRTCLGAGRVPRSAEFWRWKHERSPFGPSPVLLAVAGGRIVGVRAFLRWRWRSADQDLPAVRAVDTATHPDWQGRGVFSALTGELTARVAGEGAAFVFNTPNRKSGAGYRKMGWRTVGRLPVAVRPAAPFAAAAARRAVPLRPVADFLAEPGTEPLLAAVEGRRRQDPRLRTAATADYLRWRYAAVPGLDYRVAAGGEGEAAAAIVVRRRQRRQLVEASVTEVLIAGEPGMATAARLLRTVAPATGAHYAAAVATRGTDERRALARSGFLPLPAAGPALFVRPLATAAGTPDPLHLASWRFAAGALELF